MKLSKNIFCFENIFKVTIVVFILIYSIAPLSDPDMFFHIKNGEYIFYNWIPKIDPFSIHTNLTYIQHEWLSDIVFFLIYNLAGFYSLWLFKILINFVIFSILYFVILSVTEKNKLVSFCISGLAVMFLTDYINIRPQVFSYIIFLLEIYALEKYHKSNKESVLIVLPLLSIFLSNFHGALLPIFFFIFIIYAISSKYELSFFDNNIRGLKIEQNKRKFQLVIIFFIVSLVLTSVNPYGIKVATYSFKALSNNSLVENISELQPLNINLASGANAYLILCIIILTVIFTRIKFTLREFLFIISFATLTFSNVRFISYFILFSSVFYAAYISRLLPGKILEENKACIKLLKSVNIVGNLLFIIAFLIPIRINGVNFNTVSLDRYPVEIVPTLKQAEDIRLYNEFDFGHFLIFNGVKVFIDGRAEMYTKNFNSVEILDEYFKTYKGNMYPEEIFQKYKLNYFLVNKNTTVSIFLDHNDKYEMLVESDKFQLYRLKRAKNN